MGKPGQRAVGILGLQHQSGRYGSRASGHASNESIANGGRAAHRLRRTVRFQFREALDFVREVGELAKTEGHHPDIGFRCGYATSSLSTVRIKGLPVKDFIMASGCSIARIGPPTSSSEKVRHEMANVNPGGNQRSHRRRVRRNRLFSAAASFGSCVLADFPFGSRQGIRIGGTDCLVVTIRNFNP